jgi:hypothetical protein
LVKLYLERVSVKNLTIPNILHGERENEAADRIRHYFNELTIKKRPLFSGSTFDGFAPDRNPKGTFTGEDFLSTGLLGVHVPGEAIVKFYDDIEFRHDAERQLRRLPTDVDLGDLNEKAFHRLLGSNHSPGQLLWDLIRGNRVNGKLLSDHVGMGPTLTSKLLARKRPRLIPIWDSRIKDQLLLPDSKEHWSHMWRALTAENGALTERLRRIRSRSGQDQITLLRTFDVAVWHSDKYPKWRGHSENDLARPADDKGMVGDEADGSEIMSPSHTPKD